MMGNAKEWQRRDGQSRGMERRCMALISGGMVQKVTKSVGMDRYR